MSTSKKRARSPSPDSSPSLASSSSAKRSETCPQSRNHEARQVHKNQSIDNDGENDDDGDTVMVVDVDMNTTESPQPRLDGPTSLAPIHDDDGNSSVMASSLALLAGTPAANTGALKSAVVIGVRCAMLTAFVYDRDCLFALLNVHLTLTDIARLAATCRTCHNWVVQPSTQLLHAAHRTRVVTPRALHLLAKCDWARPMFVQIRVNMLSVAVATNEAAGHNHSHVQSAIAASSSSVTTSTVSDTVTGFDIPITLSSVVADLARFPRLSRVGLQLTSNDADRSKWRAAFEALPRLQQLELLMVNPPAENVVLPHPPLLVQLPLPLQQPANAAAGGQVPAQAAAVVQEAAAVGHAQVVAFVQAIDPPPHLGSAVAELFQELHHLPQLESLVVHNLREAPSTLDFSNLPQLPKLRTLGITLQSISVKHNAAGVVGTTVFDRLFSCSPAQVEALGRCHRLQHLRCGVWMPQPPKPALAVGVEPDEAAMAATASAEVAYTSLLTRTLGALTLGKQKALTEWYEQRDAAVRRLNDSSEINALPPPSALPLQSLCLKNSVITSTAWRFLSKCTQLTELSPLAWSANLKDPAVPKSGWAALAKFRHLRALRVAPILGEEHPLLASSLLPPILRGCRGLQSLHLQSVDLSRAQLQHLIRRLPDLRHLSLRCLRLESTVPLSEAKRLHTMSLHFCVLGGWPMKETSVIAEADAGHGIDHSTGTGTAAGTIAVAAVGIAAADSTVIPTAPSITPVLDFRRELPAMSALAQLLLHDRIRITRSTAAPLNAALLARMPRLNAKRFAQNLLADPIGAAAKPTGSDAVGSVAHVANNTQVTSETMTTSAVGVSFTGATSMEM